MGTAGGEREDRGFHIALPAHSTRRWERSCQPSSIHWCMGRIVRGSQALLGRCRSLCLCRFLTLAASLPTACCWRYQPRKHGRGSVLAMQMCMCVCVCVYGVCVCVMCVWNVCVCVEGEREHSGDIYWYLTETALQWLIVRTAITYTHKTTSTDITRMEREEFPITTFDWSQAHL